MTSQSGSIFENTSANGLSLKNWDSTSLGFGTISKTVESELLRKMRFSYSNINSKNKLSSPLSGIQYIDHLISKTTVKNDLFYLFQALEFLEIGSNNLSDAQKKSSEYIESVSSTSKEALPLLIVVLARESHFLKHADLSRSLFTQFLETYPDGKKWLNENELKRISSGPALIKPSIVADSIYDEWEKLKKAKNCSSSAMEK